MPFMFMPRISCFFGARRALRLRRVLDLTFRFDFFAFGFDIFMPGMSCIL
jgi:hypothetical protein